MISSCLMIFLALTACAQTAATFTTDISWEDVDKVLKYLYTEPSLNLQVPMAKCVLILGDLDGERRELSRFLRNKPFVSTQSGRFQLPVGKFDSETQTFVVDSPVFDYKNHTVSSDLTGAFAQKLIFDKAERLKIILVAPNDTAKDFERFSSLVGRLVDTLDINYELGSFNGSIGIVGTVARNGTYPERTDDDRIMRGLSNLTDFAASPQLEVARSSDTSTNQTEDKPKAIYGDVRRRKDLMSDISRANNYCIYQRMGEGKEKNREELRSFISEKLSYSAPVKRENYRIIVDENTQKFVWSNPDLLWENERMYQVISDKVIKAVLERIKTQHAYLNYTSKSEDTFVDGYIDAFEHMTDEGFDLFLDGSIAKNEEMKGKLHLMRFTLEKLDFYERLFRKPSSLPKLNLRKMTIDSVKRDKDSL